ncbi:MAG: putative glycoside hydrolase [Candidatus Cohnella colombiensis]|uniref:Glycoside hydrolase n=1 Tax=Candidatus Cohnella colombiensis TaxID=3121368 RepID=A0AA95EVR3_9BACL|nr:MAG: putative glycoside hydrolase [Cohnella sp.]
MRSDLRRLVAYALKQLILTCSAMSMVLALCACSSGTSKGAPIHQPYNKRNHSSTQQNTKSLYTTKDIDTPNKQKLVSNQKSIPSNNPSNKTLPLNSSSLNLNKPKQPVRGIYVSSYVALSKRMDELIELVDQTELNAMVIDINSGPELFTLPASGDVNAVHFASTKLSKRFQQLIQKLKQHNIYLIARIITFKNPALVNLKPEWALKQKNGDLWRDSSDATWINPYIEQSWVYPQALMVGVANLGFDEVQFDYVRFPENGSKVDKEVSYANKRGWSKSEVISQFLRQSSIKAHHAGIRSSADVFGLVGSSEDDMGIGQKWNELANQVDVLSPMIYPSHYAKGIWSITNPDMMPSKIITEALKDVTNKNEGLSKQQITTANVRPWLQAFTASWLHPHMNYQSAQIREQILAARNAGYNSYLLWNPSSRYPKFTVNS